MTPRVWFALVVAAMGAAGGASGQQVVTVQLSLSNPGARSMGFGGAFTAVADDATAAFANPAGLVQLQRGRPEVSIEGRRWSYSTPFTVGGRADGVPTGIGLDTAPGLRFGESSSEYSGLSFLSFAYPLRRWTIALYRHQLARFESTQETQGLFADGGRFAGTRRFHDQRGFSSTEVVNYGVSAGVRLTAALNVGIGLSFLDIEHLRRGAGYLPDDDSIDSFFGEVSFLPERRLWEDSYSGSGSDRALILGLLWRATERWSVGAVLRESFETEVLAERRPGPATASGILSSFRVRFSHSFPAVFGLGVAYRSPAGRLTGSLEWDRVGYRATSAGDPDEAIPNADELHLGGEFAFLGRSPIVAIRLGAWLDPDHRVRATQGDSLFRARLRPGEDEIHLAAGFGVAFKRFQIDFGADLSDLVDTFSISAIFSF